MRSVRLLSFLAAVTACSSSQGSTFPVTQRGVTDAAIGADAGACIVEGGMGVPCWQSVSSYCADAGVSNFTGCGTSWQTVQADPPCEVADLTLTEFASCGNVGSLTLQDIDTSATYYYDTTRGNLVGVVARYPPEVEDPNGITCAAGPPCFVLPTCADVQVATCGKDASSEAGSADAGVD
jgi:hypothetical protein